MSRHPRAPLLPRSLPVPLLCVALLAAGCSVETTLPDQAQATCAGPADCPQGFTCNTALGRCLAQSQTDSTPPALTADFAPSVALLRTGASAQLVVEADEPLAMPPRVTLEPAGLPPRTLAWDGDTSRPNRYVFTCVATGEEPEDVDVPVRALLLDRAGNPLQVATTLRFDRTLPVLGGVTVTGVPARLGGTYRVSFTASERLGTAPTVRRAGGGSALVAQARESEAQPYVFVGTATGAEGASDGLVLTASDVAGNTAELTLPDVLAFDFTPPARPDVQVLSPLVREGFNAVVRVTFDEPLSGAPVLRLVPRASGTPLPLAVVEQLGAQYTLMREIAPADAAGTYDVELVSASDLAGNPVAAATLASLQVDKTGPGLTSGPTLDRASAHYNEGALLAVEFTTDEDLGAAPVVRLGSGAGRALTCEASSARTHRCTTTVREATDPKGTTGLSISLVDLAGNQSFATVNLTLDYTAPRLVPGTLSFALVSASAVAPLTHVGVGTQVRLAFSLDEPTVAAPIVTASRGASLLQFTPEVGAGLLYAHQLAAGTWEQGPYTVRLQAQDVAGNVADLTLALPSPGLSVDTVAPGAPLLTPGGLVYHRLPWGRPSTNSTRAFYVDGGAGTAEVGALLRILDGPDSAQGRPAELGRTTVATGGVVPAFDVGLVDRTTVYAQVIDGAGNRSASPPIDEVEWVASVLDKQPGSTLENPTRLTYTSRFLPFRDQVPAETFEPTAAELALMARTPGSGFTATVQPRWRPGNALTVAPRPRTDVAAAVDAHRGKLVLFGGQLGSSHDRETWELDLVTGAWQQRYPDGLVPSARSAHAMVFDARRGRVLLVGGATQVPTPVTEVWAWDGAANLWSRLDRGTGSAPDSRSAAHVVYDERRQRVVLFGGLSSVGGVLHDDLWEFDPATGTWTEHTVSPRPAYRSGGAFVYDVSRGTALLVGGAQSDLLVPLSDVWEWNGATRTWTDRTTAVRPTAALGRTGFFDRERGVLSVHGGHYNQEFGEDDVRMMLLSEVWDWNGETGTWASRTVASGPARTGHAAAYDAVHRGLLLFGGMGANGYTNDVWLWSGAEGRFRDLSPRGEAPRRYRTGLAYDPVRKVMYLFGGSYGSTLEVSRELWEFDPRTRAWRNLTPSPLPASWPSGRDGLGLAWDEDRQRLMLHGGHDLVAGTDLADLWSYEPASGTWTQLTPAGTPPGARQRHGFVYDTVRDRLVGFGGAGGVNSGTDLADTFEWTAAPAPHGTWLRPGATGPGGRQSLMMAFDAARGRTVVFGGWRTATGYLDSLWEWDGTSWSSPAPLTPVPAGRFGPGAAWDSQRREVMFQGGICGTCPEPENKRHHRWDGAARTWSYVDDPNLPAISQNAAAFDPETGQLVVVSSQETAANTWTYSNAARERAGVVWTVPFVAAGASGALVRSVQVVADVGGRGASGSYPEVAVPGAQLHVWDTGGGEWRPVGLPNGAPPGAPSTTSRLTATFDTAESLAALRQGTADVFGIAVTPRERSGVGKTPGSVWVDGLELSVRYRR